MLGDPQVDYQLEVARHQAEVLKLRLDLQPTDRMFLEQTRVLRQQLTEIQAKIKRFEEQKEAFTIIAPFAGKVAQLPDDLAVGRWVGPGYMLALLIEPDAAALTAYVDEQDLHYLAVGNRARFYPETPV